MGRQIGRWRHLRYLLEFALLYLLARVVVPLREILYRSNRPQFLSHLDGMTTKVDIRSQKIPLLARLLSRKISSGGTTGVPVTFYEYFWVTALERMYVLYLWSLVGWRPTHRTVVFRGNRIGTPTEHRGRMLIVSSYSMVQDASKVIAEVRSFRPQWVWAYPSVFFNFRRMSNEIKLDDLQGFLFGSEKLYSWQKEELTGAYGKARVLEWYGSSEKAALAYRVYPKENFTLLKSYSVVSFRPQEEEKESWPRRCALIGTSLFQAPTRIRNYCTGDIVIAGPDGTIEDIRGREQDFIYLSDGKATAFSQAIGSIHTDVWEGIRRFRFEQERVGELEVYIQGVLPSGRERLREQFEALIAAEFGGAVTLNFHFGDIEPRRSSSGKEIYFVQRLTGEPESPGQPSC